ncbi:MAG: purine nucleoside permease [Gammaproteobacteria bacterium]|nr:purine nucleoside permease [Gammaproteobacteria bacterium]
MSRLVLGMSLLVCLLVAQPSWATEPIPVKVVVLSMFEHGELIGDRPGEFQFWVERVPLDQQFDFPLAPFPLRYHASGVLGVCIGGGVANAAATVMALGLDPRFDLSSSYWLISGIAGGDPQDTTLGSAVWAQNVVDGDLLYEIDGREIPSHWPYGMVPLGGEYPAQTPEDLETGWTLDNIHIPLNSELAQWAYQQTRLLKIEDSLPLQRARAPYIGYAAAQAPPMVMMGDTLSASTYWHGTLLNGWANDWVALYAGEAANFVTSNMEDSGTLTSIKRLDGVGQADMNRVMVLRTVSNFTLPPRGQSAAWSATAEYAGNGVPALEAAYQVGKVVVDQLLENWQDYRYKPPAPDTSPVAQYSGG